MGGGALSIALDALLQRVGVPWTFRIMGLMSLACTLPASLLLKERIPRTPTTVDWCVQPFSIKLRPMALTLAIVAIIRVQVSF